MNDNQEFEKMFRKVAEEWIDIELNSKDEEDKESLVMLKGFAKAVFLETKNREE